MAQRSLTGTARPSAGAVQRRGTIGERIAQFVDPSPSRSEPDRFRRLPKRVPFHEMRSTQETRLMRGPTSEPNADVRYACDGLGDAW
jgi:hypothetical protein